jgi:hypothetical protein
MSLLPSDVAAPANIFIAHAVTPGLSALAAIRSAMEKSHRPAALGYLKTELPCKRLMQDIGAAFTKDEA